MDINHIDPSNFIVESKIIAANNMYAFNRSLAEALADGWVQHGHITAIGGQGAINMVKYDPRYTKVVVAAMDKADAERLLSEMGG